MQSLPTTAKILIVEENEADVNLFRELFSEIHMLNEISWVRTGEEALQFVREHRPELVIMDTIMPIKNGFEVLEDIKADPELRDVGVIMAMSAGDSRYVREQAPLADGFIEKPITPGSLAEGVSKIKHFAVAIVRMRQ